MQSTRVSGRVVALTLGGLVLAILAFAAWMNRALQPQVPAGMKGRLHAPRPAASAPEAQDAARRLAVPSSIATVREDAIALSEPRDGAEPTWRVTAGEKYSVLEERNGWVKLDVAQSAWLPGSSVSR